MELSNNRVRSSNLSLRVESRSNEESKVDIPPFESEEFNQAKNTDEFLNSFENHFLDNLSRNEALLEYFQRIQESLCSLFASAKIALLEKFSIDAETNATKGLKLVGEFIPAVGRIVTGVGEYIEWSDEQAIKERLNKISNIIPSDK